MARVSTVVNNFSRAKVDHDLNGRFDLPIYNSSADIFKNFISNFKGNGIYRSGFKLVDLFQDCVLIEFEFSQEQSYICLFYENKVKFLTYDSNGDLGFVQSGGSDLEVTSPYTLEQARTVQWSQNADVMKMVHPDVEPQDFKRIAADNFTFSPSVTNGIAWGGEYPQSVLFKDGRLFFAKFTTIYGSEVGDFEEFTIPATILDDSPVEFTVADITEPIEWLFANERSIIGGNKKNPIVINGGDVNTPLTASNLAVTITGSEGSDNSIPIRKDNLVFYIGKDNRNMYYFSYDILGETFKSEDANFISYDITRGGISKIKYKKDRNDLIYTLLGNGDLVSLNFNEAEKVVGWHTHTTEGDIKDIARITDNNGADQLFLLVLRDGEYYIEILSELIEFTKRPEFFTGIGNELEDTEAWLRTIGEELKTTYYLDNSQCIDNLKNINITYDDSTNIITADSSVFSPGDVGKLIVYKTKTGYEKGRFSITGFIDDTSVDVEEIIKATSNTYDEWYLTFSIISGLERFVGKKIGIVTDGAFFGEVDVSGSVLDLGEQVTSVCVGYLYEGEIKTFSLGFIEQGVSTVDTRKAIYAVGIRLTDTGGGLVGSTPYKMEVIQELSQNDINYLPTALIDGTKLVSYADSAEVDKYLYIKQDKPLPMRVTSVIINAKYGVR